MGPQHVAQTGDAAGRKCLDRSRRNRINPNLAFSKIICQISDCALQRGLGDSHYVVVRNDFLCSVIGHSNDAAAILHQRCCPTGHSDERIDADIMCDAKALSRGVHKVTSEFRSRGKSHAMHYRVELAIALLELAKE